MNDVVDNWFRSDIERPSKFPLLFSNISVCKNSTGINVKVKFDGNSKNT